MSTAYTQIIVSAKDEASKVFQAASRRIGIELEGIKHRLFSLQSGIAGLGMGMFAQQIFEAGKSLNATKRAFVEITGSTQAAGREFQFLRKTADELGQNFYALLDPYKQLIAASKNTALEGENARQIFLGIAKAGATLGLSSEQLQGALNAVSQMISKGKVQAEELRGQLGERLPGAFQLAAQAMGVSTAELDKMLEKGEVAASDLLPKLAQVLQQKYSGSVDDATRATNKFNEAWLDFKNSLAGGEYMDAAIDALGELTDILKDKETQQAIGDLATGLVKTGKGIIKIGQGLDDVFAVYNKLPDEIVGAAGTGIIGRYLFGSWKVGTALTILQTLNTVLQELNTGLDIGSTLESSARISESFLNIWDGIIGRRHWDTGEWLEEGHSTYRAKIRRDLGNAEALKDLWLAYYKGLDAANKRAKKLNAAKPAQTIQSQLTKQQLKDLAKLKDGWMSYYAGKVKADERATKIINDRIEEQLRLKEEFTDKYKQLTLGQYGFEREQIRLQAKAYIDAGADKIKVAKWAEAEIEKINKKEVEATQKALREQTLASQNFFAGMKLGWQELQKEQYTWAQAGYDIVQDFSRKSSSTVSDILFDGITGDMKDLEDYWESFWKSMLRTMTDAVAKMTTQWATSKLMEFGVGFVDAIFHEGTPFVRDDEIIAKLQTGEMVIPREQAAKIREAIGSGGTSVADFFDSVVGAVEVGTAKTFGYTGYESFARAQIAGNIMGHMMSSALAGGAVAYNNYSRTQAIGQQLQSAGYNISTSQINSIAQKMAWGGFLSRSFNGLLGGIIGDIGMYAFGVQEYSTPAHIVTGALASLLGLGLPGAAVGALSPLTAYTMDKIADLLGLRKNEKMLDMLEDRFGDRLGRQIGAMINDDASQAFAMPGNYALPSGYKLSPYGVPTYTFARLEDLNLTPQEFFERVQEVMEAARADSYADRIAMAAHTFGKELTDKIWSGAYGKEAIEALTKDVVSNPGFYGYDSREKAYEAMGYPSDMARSLSRGGWSFGGDRADTGGGWDTTGVGGGPDDDASGYAWKTGGYINRLLVPQGEDGVAALQFGEYVVSRKGLEFLDAINSGQMPGSFANIAAEIKALRQEIRATQVELIKTNKKLYRLHQKWDVEGVKTQ